MRKRGYYFTCLIIIICVIGIVIFFQFHHIKEAIKKITCMHARKKIQLAVERYLNTEPPSKRIKAVEIYKPVDIYMLYKKGYIKHIYTCPSGGEYKINEYGEVYCTVHDVQEEKKH